MAEYMMESLLVMAERKSANIAQNREILLSNKFVFLGVVLVCCISVAVFIGLIISETRSFASGFMGVGSLVMILFSAYTAKHIRLNLKRSRHHIEYDLRDMHALLDLVHSYQEIKETEDTAVAGELLRLRMERISYVLSTKASLSF